MDLSKVSTEDLKAYQAGKFKDISDEGLSALRGISRTKQERPKVPFLYALFNGLEETTSFGFSDEIGGFGRGVGKYIRGDDGSFSELVDQGINEKREEHALAHKDRPYAAFAGNIAGAVASGPIGAAKTAAATGAGRFMQAVTHAGVQGAAQGAGDAQGGVYDRAVGAVKGAGINMATAGVLSGGGEMLRRGLANTDAKIVKEVIDEGLPLTPGEAMGSGVGAMEKVSAQAPLSGSAMREAFDSKGNVILQKIDEVFNPSSPVNTAEEAGVAIQKGLRRSYKGFLKQRDKMYDDVLNAVDDKEEIIPENTLKAIDGFLEKFGGNEQALKLANGKQIQNIRKAFEYPISVKVVKQNLKSNVYDIAEEAGRKGKGALRRDVMKIYHAIDEDIVDTIDGVNKGLGAKLKEADEFLSERLANSEDLKKIFDFKDGAVGDKATLSYVRSVAMATEGSAANSKVLKQLKETLPEQEWDAFRTYLFKNLGLENASADGFERGISPQTFKTKWKKLTPESKGILFDSKEQRGAFDTLAKYADLVSKKGVNPSGSGAVAIEGAAVGGAVFATGNPMLLTVPAFNYIYGKASQNPAFAKVINNLRLLSVEVLNKPTPVTRKIWLSALRSARIPQQEIDEVERNFFSENRE